MGQLGKILVVADPRYQDHQGPDGHPERPERLLAVEQALSEFEDTIERRSPRAAEAHLKKKYGNFVEDLGLTFPHA